MNPFEQYEQHLVEYEQDSIRKKALSCAKGSAQLLILTRLLEGPVIRKYQERIYNGRVYPELLVGNVAIDRSSLKNLTQRLESEGFTLVSKTKLRLNIHPEPVFLMYTGSGKIVIFDRT